MKVSVDGLRRNLARAYEKSLAGMHMVESENGYDTSFDQLKEGLGDMRQMIAAFMCMYSDNPDDLMSNMTEEAFKLPLVYPKDESVG